MGRQISCGFGTGRAVERRIFWAGVLFLLVGLSAGCKPTEEASSGNASAPSNSGQDRAVHSPIALAKPQWEPLPQGLDVISSSPAAQSGQKRNRANLGSLQVAGDRGEFRPLSFESLDVEVRIVGRLARTRVTQVFRNHLHRQTEGKYEFQLPEGAAISRLAMDVEGKMMEGELVGRHRARQIYDSIVRRKKDPALLEWLGNNRFSTHIFPIPARGTKTVVMTYEQLLPRDYKTLSYQYRLPHLEEDARGSSIDTFRFSLQTAESTSKLEVSGYPAQLVQRKDHVEATIEGTSFRLQGPIGVQIELADPYARQEVTAKVDEHFYFVTDVVPRLPTGAARELRPLVVVLDTSAGIGHRELVRAVQFVDALLKDWPKDLPVQVVHGDVGAHTCLESPQTGQGAQLRKCLAGLSSGGATNLEQLSLRAVEEVRKLSQPASVLWLTDGVASTGERDQDILRQQMLAPATDKGAHIYTASVGPQAVEDFLRDVAQKGQGQLLRLEPNEPTTALIEAITAMMKQEVWTDVVVEDLVGNLKGLSPSAPLHLVPGASVAVLGMISPEHSAGNEVRLALQGMFRGKPHREVIAFSPDKFSQAGPYRVIHDFWARALIDTQMRQQATRETVVKTSLEHGVMSPFTSFLVLENEAAYQRFQVDRRKQEELQRDRQTAQDSGGQQGGKEEETEEEIAQVQKQQTNLSKSGDELQKLLGNSGGDGKVPEPREPAPDLPGLMNSVGGNGINVESLVKLQGLKGSQHGEGIGLGGLGVVGTGRGGGGFGWGGAGRDGFGLGSGYGRSPGALSQRSRQTPRVVAGRPLVQGSLDKEIIRRVVRRHRREVRYCYEQELIKDPYLQGKVTVSFVIQTSGRVTSSVVKSSTLRNNRVERCVVGKIRRWVFPEPKGGGLVRVTYPFVFAHGGDVTLPKERIQFLEKNKSKLQEHEKKELFSLYNRTQKKKRALAWLGEVSKDWPEETRHISTLAWTQSLSQDALFQPIRNKAISQILTKPVLSPQDFSAIVQYYQNTKDFEGLARALRARRVPPGIGNKVLYELVSADKVEQAQSLSESWFSKHVYNAQEQSEMLLMPAHERAKAGALNALYLQAATELIQKGNREKWRLDLLVWFAKNDAKNAPNAVAAGVLACRSFSRLEALDFCLHFLPQLAHPESDAHKLLLEKHRTALLQRFRAEDYGNAHIITALATHRLELGQSDQAWRLMSELVEFAPYDVDTRLLYARELAKHQRALESCAQFGAAIQLAPRQRQIFREVMKLRRAHPNHKEGIERCLTESVSDLPVRRDISMVLTWDDPRADIDLHVYEPEGEHVWFQHLQSRHGGFLYYDITDGFGPEIYTLGAAPKGEYDIKLVYYSGAAEEVRGTLTILRDAGAPNETREAIPFVLSLSRKGFETDLKKWTLSK